ncbi:MAG: hypothetical protein AAGA90_18355 [Actinomycetota bacterium]
MDGSSGGEDGIRLDDRAVPVDPESVARAIGAAIRRAHAQPAAGRPVTLTAMAQVLLDAAAEADEPEMTSGPYLGRPVLELARLAAETVSVLPPAVGATVPIRPGLDLADCLLQPDGTVAIEGVRADGDREVELAAAAVAVGERHGPAVVAPLLDAYGMDHLDLRRLDTGQLLVGIARHLGVDLGTAGTG